MAAAMPPADDIQALAERHSVIAEGRMILEFVKLRGQNIDYQPQRAKLVRDEILCLLLVTGQAGQLDQFLQEDDQFAP